jgi:hypothetical protein
MDKMSQDQKYLIALCNLGYAVVGQMLNSKAIYVRRKAKHSLLNYYDVIVAKA